jgi:hypothetical protein
MSEKAARKRGDVESNRKREKKVGKESNPIARQEKSAQETV